MMKLVIGDRNYSSWSLRPWLMLKQAVTQALLQPLKIIFMKLNAINTMLLWKE